MRTHFRLFALLAVLVFFIAADVKAQKKVLIAAAADLRFAMDSIVALYRTSNPEVDVRVTYGSSGNFFEQISNGAPFDLFFSADVDYAKKLKEKHGILGDVQVYGTGELVLWSKTLDPNTYKMNTLLNTNISKIAIANPDHAPYGKRAVESLNYYNLYDKVKQKLVLGENISQTAQFVTTGAADVGIIALSLALSPNMQREGGKYWLIPEASHTPLEQAFVLLEHARNNADAAEFGSYMHTGTVLAVLRYFGFK